MNGYDYTEENEDTLFTFVGTANVFSYWPYVAGLILGVMALIALIMCCSALLEKMPKAIGFGEAPQVEMTGRKPGSVAGPSVQPHTLRDEFGFYRTRGFFADHPSSPSPAARGRSTFMGARGSEVGRVGSRYISPRDQP